MNFIHTGDIHLGANPDAGFPWSEVRGKEIWDSFRRLIEVVRSERVDLLLIAGDFFHRQPLVRELKEVNYLFSTIPDTQVVLMAGNHDYLQLDSYYARFPWNDNVIGMWSEECESVYLSGIHTWVYGLSYHAREITQRKYAGVKSNGKPGIHILLAHGGDEKHIPLSKEELSGAGFDYVALGHIHRPGILMKDKIAYCGALEPLDRNDVGTHGYIKGSCNEDGVSIEFVPFAQRSYIPLNVMVDRGVTQFSLEKQIRKQIDQMGAGHLYHIIIKGLRDPDIAFAAEYLMELGNITGVEDSSKPDYDIEKMKESYRGSLIGNYIRHLADDDTPNGKKALYYGLHALLEAKR